MNFELSMKGKIRKFRKKLLINDQKYNRMTKPE